MRHTHGNAYHGYGDASLSPLCQNPARAPRPSMHTGLSTYSLACSNCTTKCCSTESTPRLKPCLNSGKREDPEEQIMRLGRLTNCFGRGGGKMANARHGLHSWTRKLHTAGHPAHASYEDWRGQALTTETGWPSNPSCATSEGVSK